MTPPPDDRDPRTNERVAGVQEALARAGLHGRRALAEAVAALRALVEAAGLASGLDGQAVFQRLDALLAELGELASAGDVGARERDAVLESLLAALDREIDRWEARSREDPDARAVLRAFLGMRELCWELGLRPRPDTEDESKPEAEARSGSRRTASMKARPRPRTARDSRQAPARREEPEAQQPRPRVRRVDVEG